MQNPTEHTIDRAGWPAGEWDNEPDRVEWRDEATGLPCLMVRNRLGNWCGYAGVHSGHVLFHKEYSQCLAGCRKRKLSRRDNRFAVKKIKRRIAAGEPWAESELRFRRMKLYRKPAGVPKRHAYRYIPPERVYCRHHDSPECILDAHGGITYSDACQGPICHTPLPNERRVWWFGFDCAHAGDLVPGMEKIHAETDRMLGRTTPPSYRLRDTYKPMAYVRENVTALAAQLDRIGRDRESTGLLNRRG